MVNKQIWKLLQVVCQKFKGKGKTEEIELAFPWLQCQT